jgi:endonuclease/exonuclease/phosphatase family metal-dependent hydrolase
MENAMTARRQLVRALSVAILLVLLPITCWALDVVVGNRIELKATNPLGVPLHRLPRPSLVGRIADATVGTVVGLQNENHWLNVTLPDGRTGWVVESYVSRVLPGVIPPTNPSDDVWEVWSSAERCETVVRAGRRMVGTRANAVRVGTWNIRWFPDGEMHPSPTTIPTDLRWLACVITWMNVDMLAVQEIRTTTEAHTAWESVIDGIVGLGGGTWTVQVQPCGAARAQHVGFLWNTTRVTLSELNEVWQLNGAATSPSQPCAGNLRPGFHAYVKTHATGGPSFHTVVAHLDSGRGDRDFGNRQTAFSRIGSATAPMRSTDSDVVILGDFNTMGRDSGVSAAQEITGMTTTAASAGFDRLPVEPQCSEYFNGEGGWIDHVLVSRAMAEVTLRSATMTGYCALAGCGRITGPMPPAYQNLSDHCPIVMEIDPANID